MLGGVLGAMLFLATLGPAIVRPTNLGWLMRHDTQTYLLAWHHFRREPWQWPPGKILGVGYPVTTSIGNTDAVPLVAFPLKPLHAVLPDPGQYLGAWLLACYVLQGVFGVLLLRHVTADPALQTLGAALFVQTPALLFRTGHTALCGHWLLLAALWIAVSHPQRSYRWRLLAWSLVSAAVAATQPYLAVMVLGLAAADFASDALWPRFSAPAVPGAAGGLALVLAVMTAVFWLCGVFLVGSSDLEREGFGFYSMNLLSPVMSMRLSALLPEIPAATPGQYEGVVYFGAGWLALTLLAVILAAGRRGAGPRLRLGWVVVVAFVLYAISPVVTAANAVVLDLSASTPSILSVFRSSGRFGWLAMYVVFVAVFATTAKALPRRAALAVVAVAVMLQAWDLHATYGGMWAREHDPAWTDWDDPLDSGVWDIALPHYRHLVMVPGRHVRRRRGRERRAAPAVLAACRQPRRDRQLRQCRALRRRRGAALLRRPWTPRLRAGRVADDSLYVLSPTMRDATHPARPGPHWRVAPSTDFRSASRATVTSAGARR